MVYYGNFMGAAASKGFLDDRVEAVRRFNRFYTRKIGVLQEHLLKSSFSLSEARILYELAHHEGTTASELGEALGLDAGYLSRILQGFLKRGLLDRRASEKDGRQNLLTLNPRGQQAFGKLDADTRGDIGALLVEVKDADQARLIGAMETIEEILGAKPERPVPYLLRPPQPGDLGWVVQRHGFLYSQEYGWDESFEVLVAQIVADFARHFDTKRERCWIAEKDGENVGAVFLVKKTKTVAKLRLLLVEPSARGLGLGGRLVEECVRFARQAGYRKLTLWTNSVLHAARRIYERAGFRLVHEKPHHSFGQDLLGQTWELDLRSKGLTRT